MFKRKLFKRALPIILSVAMVFQSMPATAYAAEYEESEIVVSESDSEASEAEETQAAEPEVQETAQAATEAKETEIVETTTDDAPITEEAEGSVQVEENAAGEAALKTELDTTGIKDYYLYNEDTGRVTETYTGSEVFQYVVDNIKYGSYVTVTVDGEKKNELRGSLKTEWQKSDGTKLETSTTPVDAGVYKLVISLDKQEGVCSEATATLEFEIKKAQLTLTDFVDTANVGDTFADFTEKVKETYSVQEKTDKDAYIKSLTLKLIDSVTGAESADTVFVQGKDYAYEVSATLLDNVAANYELAPVSPVVIELNDGIVTTMEITLTDSTKTAIEHEYTGEAITFPEEGKDYTVKVYDEENLTDGEHTAIKVAADAITKEWLDADKNTLTEAPVKAGSYNVRLTYTDAAGRYAKATDLIEVVITPKSAYVKPALEDGTVVYSGMTGYDILKKVTYTVKETKGDADVTVEDGFWGVSYSDASKTQLYEPVFALQKAELVTELDEDGKETAVKDKDGKVQYTGWADALSYEYLDNSKVDGSASVKYRIVFTGKKAVYDAYGNCGEEDIISVNDHGTNSQSPDYRFDLSEETIDKTAIELTITDAKEITIDISQYTGAETGKVYDGEPLYAARKDYKKATLPDGANGSLYYGWFSAYKSVDITEDKDGKLVREESWEVDWDGEEQFWKNDTDVNGVQFDGVSPKNAGTYALVIGYDDPSGETVADGIAIYYTIEQQQVQAELSLAEGAALTAHKDMSVWDFIDANRETILNEVKKLDGNDRTKPLVSFVEDEAWEEVKDYGLEFVVEEEITNDKGEKEWTEAYAFTADGKYRIKAAVDVRNDNYTNSYITIDETTKEDVYNILYSNTLDINIVKGEEQLTVDVDASKIVGKKYDGTPLTISADAVKVTNSKGEAVTDAALTYRWYNESTNELLEDAPVNAGSYDLYISFAGDDKYAPLAEDVYAEDVTIEQRVLQIKPVIKAEVVAGTSAYYYNVVDDFELLEGSDILESEMDYFSEEGHAVEEKDEEGNAAGTIVYRAIYSVYGYVYEQDGKNVENAVLRGEKTYQAIGSGVKWGFYPEENESRVYFYRNYKAEFVKAEFTTVRGVAEITRNDVSIKDTVTKAETGVQIHTITAKEGVPFYPAERSGVLDKDGNAVSGNFVKFDINAPKEYYNEGYRYNSFIGNAKDFVYENSIEAAGGYVLNSYDGTITVAFPVTKEDVAGSAEKKFTVRWEQGYTEEFVLDCAGMTLEDDLTKAVAPKSLAFNSPVTKMVVGDKQQLDVKLTKVKLDDVICLKYETDNAEVLSVTEAGFVTALATGSAMVKAIPCYLDENGDKQPIEGAKIASAKITVADVTAPKINKISAVDGRWVYGSYEEYWENTPVLQNVEFTSVDDGYRREIYFLEGKQTVETFEGKITSMKNGDWESAGFANAPTYSQAVSSAKNGTISVSFGGLQPNTEYTVYVRNVSGIRTLADGTRVAVSHAGSVKNFKTTLPQVDALKLTFDEKYYNEDRERFEIPYTEGKASTLTTGWFYEKYTDESVNIADRIEYSLAPEMQVSKDTYVQPKLSYYVTDNDTIWDYVNDWYTDEENGTQYSQLYLNAYKEVLANTTPSAIAKVDKKGTLTITGVGTVYVLVYDTNTGRSSVEGVTITAEADDMTMKAPKAKVGQRVNILDCITWTQNKKNLTGYADYMLDEYGFSNWLEITVEGEGFNHSGRYLTAVKAGATAKVTVKDKLADVTKDMTLTAAAMDAVKDLKVSAVTDKYATVSFTYPYDTAYEYNDNVSDTQGVNQVYARVQVMDASKNVVSDEYYSLCPGNYWYGDEFWMPKYDAKKKVWTYNVMLDGLKRKSNYTVSVTACCLNEKSKAAAKSFKTTDIPAAQPYEYEGDFYSFNSVEYLKADGGMYVEVNCNGLDEHQALTSNNTYTLDASGANRAARNRKSDTLTWKSTNTKVASVKANAGSYTATLNTLRKGTTQIEVSSNLTKRIIARWTVFVNAVGEAEWYFGDENFEEDEYGYITIGGTDYELQLLGIGSPVSAKLNSGEMVVAKFVAPAYGSYNFTATNGTMRMWVKQNDEEPRTGSYIGSKKLNQGQVVYLATTYNGYAKSKKVTVSVTGTVYQSVGIGQFTVAEDGKTIAFTAPEDNYYTLYKIENGEKALINAESLSKGDTWTINRLSKGTYRIEKRNTKALALSGLTGEKLAAGETVWYAFTAEEANEYTLTVTDKSTETGNITSEIYDSIKDGSSSAYNSVGRKIALEKNGKVYLAITNRSEDKEATVDITVKAVAEVLSTVTGTKTMTLANADENYYLRLTLPEEYQSQPYLIKITATAGEGDAATAVELETAELVYDTDSTAGASIPRSGIVSLYHYSNGFLCLKSATANTTVTVTITKVADTKNVLADNAADAEISLQEAYKLTFAEAGTYNITVQPIANESKAKAVTRTPVNMEFYSSTGSRMYPDASKYGTERDIYNYKITTSSPNMTYYAVPYTEHETGKTTTTVAVAKLADKPLALGGEGEKTTLVAGQEAWYSFTAAEAGRYSITASAASAGAAEEAADVTVTYYERINNYYPMDKQLEQWVWLEKDAKFYAKVVQNNTDNADITVKAEKLTGKDLTPVNPGDKAVSEETGKTAGSYTYYQISGEGEYTVQMDGKDSWSGAGYSVYGAKDEASDRLRQYYYNGYWNIVLKSGESYTIAVKANESLGTVLDYNITVKKKNIEKLTVNGSGVAKTLKAGDELFVEFDVTDKGIYAIALDGLTEGAQINYSCNSGSDGNEYTESYYATYNNTEHTADNPSKCQYKITTTSESDISFTVKVIKEEPKAAQTDTITREEAAKGHVEWYSVTAPEDGIYVMNAADAGMVYVNTDLDYPNLRETEGVLSITKDKPCFVGVYFTSAPEADVAVSLTKLEPEALSSGEDGTTLTFAKAGEYKLVSFDVTSNCEVTVKGTDITGTINYSTIMDRLAGNSNIYFYSIYSDLNITKSVVKGTKYMLFQADADNSSIKLSYTQGNTLPTLNVGENTVEEATAGGEKYFAFTVEQQGIYSFASANKSYIYVTAPGMGLGNDSSGRVFLLEAGDVVLVEVYYRTGETDTLTVTQYEVANLSLNKAEEADVSKGYYKWTKFTAAKTGKYQFTAKSDEYLYKYMYLYNEKGKQIGGYGSSNPTEQHELKAGETVYVKTYPSSSSTTTGTYTITVTEVKN